MEPKRHVSRWHAAVDGSDSSRNGRTPVAATVAAGAASEALASGKPPVSLRYLNEFVGKLQCAPALLEHKLYPDAKEITEVALCARLHVYSMGVFNAVRKYMLRDDQEAAMQAELSSSAASAPASSEKADGIIVVGDGSTPRTAAMFAHRLRHWKSYSIDPAMEYKSSERSHGWESIGNLVVIRNKIEKVRITLRRAIVVLVHAHVTLEQALSAIDAEMIVGVITLPCCNWFSKQETLFARHPDLVYDDFSILSEKREVRLWVGGEGRAPSTDIVMVDTEVKVCVRKTFVGDGESDDVAAPLSTVDQATKASAEAKQSKAFHIVKDLLTIPSEQEVASEIEESDKDSSVPFPVAEVTAQVNCEKHVLVLEGGHADNAAAKSLLRSGYRHVYTLAEPTMTAGEENPGEEEREQEHQQEAMTVAINKLSMSLDGAAGSEPKFIQERQGYILIATKAWTKQDQLEPEEGFAITFESKGVGSSFAGLDCVVDNRFVYRGFRGERRNVEVFRKLCALVYQIAASVSTGRHPLLLSVTPRKIWRKKAYLAHDELQFEIQTLTVKQQRLATRSTRTPEGEKRLKKQDDDELTFIYCCTRSKRDAAITLDKRELEMQHQTKESVLAMKHTLQREFDARKHALGIAIAELSVEQVLVLKRNASVVDRLESAERKYVQVVGKISYLRSYTSGMAFLSLVPPHFNVNATDDAAKLKEFKRNPVQAFLKLDELQWSPALLKDVITMLHPGDEVCVLGFLGKSARGSPLILANAISFVRGEFEAYV